MAVRGRGARGPPGAEPSVASVAVEDQLRVTAVETGVVRLVQGGVDVARYQGDRRRGEQAASRKKAMVMSGTFLGRVSNRWVPVGNRVNRERRTGDCDSPPAPQAPRSVGGRVQGRLTSAVPVGQLPVTRSPAFVKSRLSQRTCGGKRLASRAPARRRTDQEGTHVSSEDRDRRSHRCGAVAGRQQPGHCRTDGSRRSGSGTQGTLRPFHRPRRPDADRPRKGSCPTTAAGRPRSSRTPRPHTVL